MRKIYSIICAFILGLLCIAPPEFLLDASQMAINLGAKDPTFKSDYAIPIFVNSFNWLYLVIASGLVGYYLVTRDLHLALKFLMIYLFVGCFFSEVPYVSFNAYMVIIGTMLFFLMLRKCDFKHVIDVCQAVFWLELTIAILRLMGRDTLMNFGRTEGIFFGTIFQHMRFASMLCILSPFLLIRSRWYIIPIGVAVVLCTSSGFALSILAGCLVYVALKQSRKILLWTCAVALPAIGTAVWLGRDSFAVAFREGRIPIWGVILKSWLFNTKVNPDQSGPFSLKTFLFGHGLDTFYPMFAAYKHDPNPFAQAHNCWIQLPWEIGLIGFTALGIVYLGWLVIRLYQAQQHELLAGLSIIGTNMMFHFPTRMTQTIWLIVAFLALCEQRIKSRWQS